MHSARKLLTAAIITAMLFLPQAPAKASGCGSFFLNCDLTTMCYGGWAFPRSCTGWNCSQLEQECNAYCNDWSSGTTAIVSDCVEDEYSVSGDCLCV